MPYKGLGHRKKVRDRYKGECCMSNAMKRIMRKWRKSIIYYYPFPEEVNTNKRIYASTPPSPVVTVPGDSKVYRLSISASVIATGSAAFRPRGS